MAADKDSAGLQGAIAAVDGPAAYVVPFVGNLSHSELVDGLFRFAVERMGGTVLFIANAGFGYCERLERADWQHIDAVYRTNVSSPIYAIEKMAELPHESPYRVVITGSVLGRIALEGYALYTSTKPALDRLLEGYRLELGERGRLTLAYPLAVRTNFFRTAGDAPIPWLTQSAEQVARTIIRGIETDRDTIYTSWMLRVMLFADRILPFVRRVYQRTESREFRRWWTTRSDGQGRAKLGNGLRHPHP